MNPVRRILDFLRVDRDVVKKSHHKIIVHYHIYKTAGSTILEGMRTIAGKDGFVEIDKHAEFAGEKAYNIAFFERLAISHPELSAFTAHRVVPNIHQSRAVDVFPIAFVRHPLLRANSVYRFELIRRDDWPRKEIARQHDFAGWLDWCLGPEQFIECRNVQSRLFSLADNGRLPMGPPSALQRGDLALVFERLDSMPVVGVVEHFERSLAAINRAAQPLFPGFEIPNARVNVTKVVDDWQAELAAVEAEIPRTVLDRFYEANADDLAMFERYRARLLAMPEHAAI